MDKEHVPAGTSETTDSTSLHVSVNSNILLMTCQVMVETPQGVVKARALLDTGFSASFVSERVAQALRLRRMTQNPRICGIAGLQHSDGKQSVTQILISSMRSSGQKHKGNAFIVPQTTGDLPVYTLPHIQSWKHLDGLTLADPDYNKTGRIDVLLGIGVFVHVIPYSGRSGPYGSPTALNTAFGWVLAGNTGSQNNTTLVATHLTSVLTGDDILR